MNGMRFFVLIYMYSNARTIDVFHFFFFLLVMEWVSLDLIGDYISYYNFFFSFNNVIKIIIIISDCSRWWWGWPNHKNKIIYLHLNNYEILYIYIRYIGWWWWLAYDENFWYFQIGWLLQLIGKDRMATNNNIIMMMIVNVMYYC